MNIVIVEDASHVLECLMHILAQHPEFRVVGQARGEDEAVALITDTHPDVILLDLALSPGSGLNVLRRIRAAGVNARVAMFTNQPAALYEQACIEAGANAYFDKTGEIERLIERLKIWQPPVPENERERVAALHALRVLDTPEEERFNAIARLAARLAQTPIALVTLVDAERQWFKARVGFDAQETLRSLSFCAHAVAGGSYMEIEDALSDVRFNDHPAVMGDPHVRFYAGMPLVLPGGEKIGTLCVVDSRPRRLDDTQRMALEVLSNSVVAELELRRRVTELQQEVARRHEAEQRILHLATRDALTGLPNRAALMDRLGQAIRAATRDKREFAVLFMDLDRFKWVNDTLGHEAGDALLVALAQRFVRLLRESDTVARLGGDEFAFILPLQNGAADAEHIAAKLIRAIAEPVVIRDETVEVGCSIGVVLFPGQGSSEELLLRNADLAMYRAKAQGGNRAVVYSEEMNQRVIERITLESELKGAIEGDELELYYQPQVSLADETLIGIEALVRWNHPRLGFLSPDRFIPIAEETGLIWHLGLKVLELAAAQVAQWQRHGRQVPRVAVNVSPIQLREGLPDAVCAVLRRHGLAPSALELELTETALTSDGPTVMGLLHRLREAGIGIAIDDFGVGYSSLALLRRIPISTLKIDRSFVTELVSNAHDAAIVEAVLTMARSLGLRTVAEGVETEAQHVALRLLGCEGSQGYYYERPMSVAQLSGWLDAYARRHHGSFTFGLPGRPA